MAWFFLKLPFVPAILCFWLLLLRCLTTCMCLQTRELEVQVPLIAPTVFMCKKGAWVFKLWILLAIGLKHIRFESATLLSAVEPNSTFSCKLCWLQNGCMLVRQTRITLTAAALPLLERKKTTFAKSWWKHHVKHIWHQVRHPTTKYTSFSVS